MIYSVHDLPKRLDLYNKLDWQDRISLPDSRRELEISFSRDPLHWSDFGLELHAVWGFDIKTSEIKILLGDRIDEFVGNACRYRDRRNQLGFFAALAPRLASLAPFCPTIERLLGIIAPDLTAPHSAFEKFKHELSSLSSGDFALEWTHGKELVLVALVDRSSGWAATDTGLGMVEGFKEKFQASIGTLYDYYFYRQRMFRSVPNRLFQCNEGQENHILRVFSDPLAFDPREPIPEDAFLWPWQRSIGVRYNENAVPEVYYRSIPTTSLVLDIRASTTAMDLSVESAAFAQLIDDIVEDSRKIIIGHDGFFDKETGDGIVGHFCHATSSMMMPESSRTPSMDGIYKAVQAGIEIVRAVQARCRTYQPLLIHGLAGLGPAVGIHSGHAVWLADGSQIRAIGPAVVGASRLCSRAEVSEIILSNQSFQAYAKGVSLRHVESFQKKALEIKEYNQKAGLYGHVLRVDDL